MRSLRIRTMERLPTMAASTSIRTIASKFADPDGIRSTTYRYNRQQAPFGHLLNYYFASTNAGERSPMDPIAFSGAPNYYRILDFVEVPSRYVGTDTLLSPEIFNDVPRVDGHPTEPVGTDITGLDDPRYTLQPPFNKVSRERDPGRVNLNTVTGRRIRRIEWIRSAHLVRSLRRHHAPLWRRQSARSDDHEPTLLQLSHFGPAWRDVVLSRRGYAQYVADPTESDPVEKMDPMQIQPDTFAFGLNPQLPIVLLQSVPLGRRGRSGAAARTWCGRASTPPGCAAIIGSGPMTTTLITNPFASQGKQVRSNRLGRRRRG